MRFLGIDLHTDGFTVAVMEMKEGKAVIRLRTYRLQGRSFEEFLDGLETEDYLLVEASTNSFWFYDRVAGRVKACYVYNVNKARSQGNKTDKLDARRLVKKLAYSVLMGGSEREELPTVYVPGAEVRDLRALLSTYRLLGKTKIQLKNRIHSLLKQNGICIDRKQLDREAFGRSIEDYAVGEVGRFQLRALWRQRQGIEGEQRQIRDRICLLGAAFFAKQIELLLSIPGFSVFTAVTLMAEVADLQRFTSVKRFCSYLGVTPGVRASNQTVHLGPVNRQSRSLTCTLLTQSVPHFAKAGEHMGGFYARMRKGKSAGKARIALIRKMLVSVYYMLVRGERYHWVDAEQHARKLGEMERQLRRARATQEKEVLEAKSA
jgi:transposase